jgi:hypothetical protein
MFLNKACTFLHQVKVTFKKQNNVIVPTSPLSVVRSKYICDYFDYCNYFNLDMLLLSYVLPPLRYSSYERYIWNIRNLAPPRRREGRGKAHILELHSRDGWEEREENQSQAYCRRMRNA